MGISGHNPFDTDAFAPSFENALSFTFCAHCLMYGEMENVSYRYIKEGISSRSNLRDRKLRAEDCGEETLFDRN